ncbi:extracellular solute-binding protein [Halorhabdus sp. CBA1104]|uniref:extracellular solute-binding protein n=1 Tax=Halorhabdus sp. CBA1104 TaxID=1380432 RepID=UPI0012B1C9BC|nr:extracellular solute-binding protein [Halorhabdus sp. CBA1104]QGN07745.1 extracellular solute-binding protein [Halorhabdus sp. CBA1104]
MVHRPTAPDSTVRQRVPGHRTRRRFLAGAASLGVGALGGCLGGVETTVSVLSAGSLAAAFEEQVGPAFADATSFAFQGTYYGSRAVMRLLVDEQRQPDVVVSADATLLRDRLQPAITEWDVVFATNALAIVYNPATDVGRRLGAGDPWHEVLASPGADIARTDPALDPLGYRAIQLFELAESYYDHPGLAATLRDNTTIEPEEPQLLAAVESGQRAAAIAYRNMAHDWGLPAVDLPPKLDFSAPRLADHYATATYTGADGTSLPGRPIRYNASVPDSATNPDAGRRFVRYLTEHPDLLEQTGLVVPDSVPSAHGAVPEAVRPSTPRSGEPGASDHEGDHDE